MGDSSTSSQRRRSDDAQDDTAADAGLPTDDTAANAAGAVQTPDAGPAASACDILRPLSSGSFPVPNSGSLAWLARQQQQSQQQQTAAPPRISVTREKSLQSDSGSSATVESFDRESPPRAAASAGQQEANQSSPVLTSPPPTKSADEYDGQPQHVISPSPYASIFSEEADPTSPLLLRRCDEHDNTKDDPVRKYSESLQLFRRNEDEQDKTWKRRVVEYR